MAAEWFYTSDRRQMGPVSWRELRELAETGTLKPHDMVWCEGMTDWIKAINYEGLFADGAETEAVPQASAYVDSKPPPGRRTRIEEDDVEDERDIKRPERKRRRKREGSSVGIKIALIVAGVLGILLLLGCAGGTLVWMAVAFEGGKARTQDYTINNLPPGGDNHRRFEFKRGQRVVITVDSTVTQPGTDVDLLVSRGLDDIVASDLRNVKDCRVEFVVPVTGPYDVTVQNLGPGMARTCAVRVTEK